MTALCLRYTDFIYRSESELLEIIKQRNSDYVRRFMDNARIISAEEHSLAVNLLCVNES